MVADSLQRLKRLFQSLAVCVYDGALCPELVIVSVASKDGNRKIQVKTLQLRQTITMGHNNLDGQKPWSLAGQGFLFYN